MKNTWYTCNLGDAMLAGESLDQIRAAFLSVNKHRHASGERAIFVRHESEGRLHCEVRVYFSPAAAGVAKVFGAAACTKPSAHDLGLLAGPEAAWKTLFPGD
jgi:hypothetical protein